MTIFYSSIYIQLQNKCTRKLLLQRHRLPIIYFAIIFHFLFFDLIKPSDESIFSVIGLGEVFSVECGGLSEGIGFVEGCECVGVSVCCWLLSLLLLLLLLLLSLLLSSMVPSDRLVHHKRPQSSLQKLAPLFDSGGGTLFTKSIQNF